MLVIGIDPGLKNTGVAILEDGKYKESFVRPACFELVDSLVDLNPDLVGIERYVNYGAPVDLEMINRFIGWLEYAFRSKVKMYRAIDWQKQLLSEYGSFPIKYSRQGKIKRKFKARDFVRSEFNLDLKTEHEADAFLIAYITYKNSGV